MADDILIQGKSFPWKVDDQGRAHVIIKASEVSLGSDPEYATLYDSVSDTLAYTGKAVPGTATNAASWQIKRLTFNSEGDVIMEFADGNANFDNVWDNRASLTYS